MPKNKRYSTGVLTSVSILRRGLLILAVVGRDRIGLLGLDDGVPGAELEQVNDALRVEIVDRSSGWMAAGRS